MFTQLSPQIPVHTDKGRGLAMGVTHSEEKGLNWIVVLDKGGDICTLRSSEVRAVEFRPKLEKNHAKDFYEKHVRPEREEVSGTIMAEHVQKSFNKWFKNACEATQIKDSKKENTEPREWTLWKNGDGTIQAVEKGNPIVMYYNVNSPKHICDVREILK